MVLHDDEYLCVLCDERCESQAEYRRHLSTAHNAQKVGYNDMAVAQHTNQQAFYGSNVNRLSSPFTPTARQTYPYLDPAPQREQIQQPPSQQQQPTAHYTYTYATLLTAPTPVFPQQSQLLTPPNSRGFTSPATSTPWVPTPTETYVSPHTTYATPQQVSCSPHQQDGRYGGYMATGGMLQRGPQAHLSPHHLAQQTLQRQVSTSRASTPKAAAKSSTPAPPNRPAKLDHKLPLLPQAIYDLGLTDYDFDPTADHGKNCIASRYVDIPATIDIDEEHMFNANESTILGFGNLLRLAARYEDWELAAKFNANRPRTFKSALVKKRLQAAVKWAANRPEWQHVGDVGAWLEEKQKARQIFRETGRCKRKREDDVAGSRPQCFEGAADFRAATGQEDARFITPPPAKKARPAGSTTPQQLPTPPDGDHRASDNVKEGAEVVVQSSRTSDIQITAQWYATPADAIPWIADEQPQRDSSSSESRPVLHPEKAPAQGDQGSYEVVDPKYGSDFDNLCSVIGEQGALNIARATGLTVVHNMAGTERQASDQAGASGVVEKGPSHTVIEIVDDDEDFEDLFREYAAHPGNFMSRHELKVGEKFADFTAMGRLRWGWT